MELFESCNSPDQDKTSQEQIKTFVSENKMQKAAQVCLLHETADGSLLFNGNALKSKKISVEDLTSYDAVLAGDIHLRQKIGKNGRAMYVGSLVQQNLGENYEEHGFLFEKLNLTDNHSTYRTNKPSIVLYNIYNEKGFLKVTILKGFDKTLSNKPINNNYYEIVHDEEATQVRIIIY